MNSIQIQDDLADEDMALFQHVETPIDFNAKKNFSQWHLPRKQFIRLQQWCSEVAKLTKDITVGNGQTFNYLTLPGDDLLDIRALIGVMERAGGKLRYLGFNSVAKGSSSQREMNISRAEVKSSGFVDDFSHIEEDRLETLSNPNSPSSRRLNEIGHCHAINLDFCRSLSHGDIEGGALGAMRSILHHQLQSNQPWLLFVTTKVEPELIAEQVKSGFDRAIRANIDASDEFKNLLAMSLGTSSEDLSAKLNEAWEADGSDLLRVFTLGFSKWLLRTLVGEPPMRSLHLLSAYYYRSGSVPNMVSLAFRCDPMTPPMNDRDGVYSVRDQAAPVCEVKLGLKVLEAASHIVDLDQQLHDDPALNARMLEKSGRLLAHARYNEDEYHNWAQRNQINPTLPQVTA